MHGENYHMIGTLLPKKGSQPKFAQLYIHDTANEISNRINSVRSYGDSSDLQQEIIEEIRLMLDENDIFVKSFRMAKDRIVGSDNCNVSLKLIGKRGPQIRTYNLPEVSEVAALVVGDLDETYGERDIIIDTQTGTLKRINELHPSYLGLQYPLIFAYGEDGYRNDICYVNSNAKGDKKRNKVTVRNFFAFRFHDRVGENTLLLKDRRLTQQLIVDAYTIVESGRLLYVRRNQKELRCEMYNQITDALIRGENDSSMCGKRVILPSSFTGGPRYMIQNYQDAMTICAWNGYPDLFIMFTCNPKWPEITRYIGVIGLHPEDRSDIVSRVFKVKLDGLIKDLRQNKVFGNVRAVIYTTEFQKRGLPHAHILLFLEPQDKMPSAKDIDRCISAEIPDKETDPVYYDAVSNFMMHGPCGISNKNAPCMSKNGCKKFFPKDFVSSTTFYEEGYPVYKRTDNGRTIVKGGVPWTVGNDHVTAAFYNSSKDQETSHDIDEIKMYYDCRYISPCEAIWRIFAYNIHFRDPAVQGLSFHLQNEQPVYYSGTQSVSSIVTNQSFRTTTFEAWFKANEKYPEGRNLTYPEYPQNLVWSEDRREWVPRKRGFLLGRPYYIPPGSGERYYPRYMINVVRGAMSHKDMMVVKNVQYDSYKDACYALGIINDDKKYVDVINEASKWASAKSLRRIFCTLIMEKCIKNPRQVWEQCWAYLSDDVLYCRRKSMNLPAFQMTEDEIKNFALIEIERILRRYGGSLKDVDSMPYPNKMDSNKFSNQLVFEEMQYDVKLLKEDLNQMLPKLTHEQKNIFDLAIDSIDNNKGKIFFVYGYGGTGKIFVWKILSAAIRCKREIVLNVASSGIASLLLPGGRTTHSRFKIPLTPGETSTCNIRLGTDLAELIQRTKLIIWDEAPMMHKYCFEALDRTFKDIMKVINPKNFEKLFGGKTMVFGGDFRQILPVIPKGRRHDIVSSAINASYIWKNCEVLHLTKNIRLHNSSSNAKGMTLCEFSTWIASIGDGTIGEDEDGTSTIHIPKHILIHSKEDHIDSIVHAIYPNLNDHLDDPKYLQERAILAPTLDVVDTINEHMIKKMSGECQTYYSSNTASTSDSNSEMLADLQTP